MKPDDLIEVCCTKCKTLRQIKWSAYKQKKEGPPYMQCCKPCSQQGKIVSNETREKIKKKLQGVPQSQEMKEALRQYRLKHPTENLVPGAGAGWNKGMDMLPRSEETKKKISETMKKRKENKNESD